MTNNPSYAYPDAPNIHMINNAKTNAKDTTTKCLHQSQHSSVNNKSSRQHQENDGGTEPVISMSTNACYAYEFKQQDPIYAEVEEIVSLKANEAYQVPYRPEYSASPNNN